MLKLEEIRAMSYEDMREHFIKRIYEACRELGWHSVGIKRNADVINKIVGTLGLLFEDPEERARFEKSLKDLGLQ